MPHILLTDETNIAASSQAIFFIYGGIFLPVDKLEELHDSVQLIRLEYGFRRGDSLKFDTHSRPQYVSQEQHRDAKAAVIEACLDVGLRFVAQLVHHGIARNRDQRELISWGASTVFAAFDRFLEQEGDFGICVVDRLPFREGYDFLKEKFARGMVFDDGRPDQPLSQVILYASSSDGASHASSATDIVLGAFRYCVNERERLDVPARILPKLATMMWHRREGDVVYLREYGLLLRPREVASPDYQQDYADLIAHFEGLIRRSQSST